ncbi:MAG: arginine--tRNA ligase [Acidimicrobiia bacterium]|nr:arginine--tRNA ligase [Acidimicrobiia bacterium]
MADPLELLADRLRPAFERVAGLAGVDPVVRPSEHADAQANGALPLAKSLGRPPRDIAAEVLAAVEWEGLGTAELAEPGFLNITFDAGWIAELVAAVAADDRLGVATTATPQTVVVDYSAPNVAKEIHIGHLRTTVIGDSLVRMLELVGHTVVRENHIGDWGRPFGMLIEHLVDLGSDRSASMAVGDLDAFYKTASAQFEHDEDFATRARARVVALQSLDPETIALWRSLVEQSATHWNDVYGKLGVLLTDDDIAGESRYWVLLPEVLERLDATGLLEESDGAQVVFPPGFTNREGQPLPLIVRSQAGAFTYATSDLACVLDRVERVGADTMLYVVGAPQAQHLAMVFAVAEMAGWLRPPRAAVHVAFGNVLGPDRKMLKSRSGEPVRFVDVVDEAIERGVAAVGDKNPELPEAEQRAVGHAVGVGALKYADLSTDRIRDYVFDWERMLSFDGNTAPYLQYAHARICSIFRRADVERTSGRGHPPTIAEVPERALAMRVLGYPSVVGEALERWSPHRLCTYLFELASDFTTFYEHCPVLRTDDETRRSRLVLCDVTARVLEDGLGLLGINAPTRM